MRPETLNIVFDRPGQWKPSKEHFVSVGKLQHSLRDLGQNLMCPCGLGNLVQHCEKMFMVVGAAT